jgi:hypothetical protein
MTVISCSAEHWVRGQGPRSVLIVVSDRSPNQIHVWEGRVLCRRALLPELLEPHR